MPEQPAVVTPPEPAPAAPPAEVKPASDALTLDAVKNLLADQQRGFEQRLEAQRNSIFAEIRRGTKAPEAKKETSTPPSSEESRRIDALEKELKSERIAKGLTAAIAASGIDAKNQAKAIRYFSKVYDDRLDQDDAKAIVFKEGDGTVKPLSDYVAAWARSEEGSMFMLPPAGASSDALRGGKNAAAATASKYAGMDFGQMMEARKIDPEGFNSYLEANRDEFYRKKSEFERGGFKTKK